MDLVPASDPLVEAASRFAREVLWPQAAAWDHAKECPPSILRQLGELGLFGLLVPERLGGAGASFLEWTRVMEEIAAGNGGISTILHVHAIGACDLLVRFGTAAQQARFLPGLVSGQTIGAFCLTEPGAGSDAGAIRTRARREGDAWVLDGEKQFISNGKIAGLAIVAAVTDPAAGKRGISLFAVPTETPGYRVARLERKMGQRVSDTAQISLEGCRVPHALMIGEPGTGLPTLLDALANGRISIAAQAVGMARSAFDCALHYARQRRTFGKAIIEHQAVGFRLADMAAQIDLARVYVHHASAKLDRGEPCLREAAIAKLFAAEMAERVCSEAMQIHGGYGYVEDFPVERIYRDVRVCRIYEGTDDIQRLIIARELRATA